MYNMYKSFWQSGTVNARKLIGLPEVSMEDWAVTVFQDVGSDREVATRFSGSPRQRIMKQIGFFYIEGLEAGALKREEM